MKDVLERIEVLKQHHKELDVLIQQEYAEYKNDQVIEQHKKEKLKIKDEIERLKATA